MALKGTGFFNFLKLALTLTKQQTPRAKLARAIGFLVYTGLTASVVTELLLRKPDPKELATIIILVALVLVMGLLVSLGGNQLHAVVWNSLVSFVVVALVCALGYGVFRLLKTPDPVPIVSERHSAVPPTRTRPGYCSEDPISKLPYVHHADPFIPQHHMTIINGQMKQVGGDNVNPGHEFTFSWNVPEGGVISSVSCHNDGSHEHITVCQPSDDRKTAQLVGWINGQGGLTYMDVVYKMPCEVPVEANLN
jgi:hypothetical protein